jgi:alpha-L-fucosidase
MKYIVMVSKHHDGFSMFDTAFSDYNVMNTPFKRDILGEMAAATHRAGLKFGFYYSQRDWYHRDYSDKDLTKYNDFMKNQVRELLTKYKPVSVIFFDNEYLPAEAWDAKNLIKMIHEIQPDIVINDRCCVPADFSTPEQRLGSFDLERDWESCMTFTGFWSWHGFTTTVIPYEECLQRLIRCAGGNGNLLMNVGPMPTGQIDPREADRLKRVGDWLAKNGESIYATRGGPYKPGSFGVSTRKGDTVYLHIMTWNGDTVALPALPTKVVTASLMDGTPLQVEQTPEALRITVAEKNRQKVDTVVKLKLEGSAMDITPINTPQAPKPDKI